MRPPLDKRLVGICAVVFLVGLAAAFVIVKSQGGFSRAAGGDGPEYIAVARSMAAGRGYINPHSHWPADPSLARLPLWPILLVPGALLLPNHTDGFLLRGTGALVHALGAVCLALLAFHLSRDYLAAALSGTIFAIYPPALSLVDGGYSEPAFVVFAAAGLLLLFQTGWRQVLGAVLLGASVLVRSNLLILPFLAALLATVFGLPIQRHGRRFALLTAIFLVPAGLWIARNYLVSGAFPMLTGADGETLYGGNNPVVANEMAYWGNWVFADQIPNEIPERVLAQTMNEKQVDHYYLRKAFTFMHGNALSYPRLVTGKLVRSFIPVPWIPSLSSYFASFVRLVLFLGVFWALHRHAIRDPQFIVFLWALFATTVITTVIFCGTFRYTFCLEVFLIVVVAIQLASFGRGLGLRSSARNAPSDPLSI